MDRFVVCGCEGLSVPRAQAGGCGDGRRHASFLFRAWRTHQGPLAALVGPWAFSTMHKQSVSTMLCSSKPGTPPVPAWTSTE